MGASGKCGFCGAPQHPGQGCWAATLKPDKVKSRGVGASASSLRARARRNAMTIKCLDCRHMFTRTCNAQKRCPPCGQRFSKSKRTIYLKQYASENADIIRDKQVLREIARKERLSGMDHIREGSPWLRCEDWIINKDDLSFVEMSSILQRTYGSIVSRRDKLLRHMKEAP